MIAAPGCLHRRPLVRAATTTTATLIATLVLAAPALAYWRSSGMTTRSVTTALLAPPSNVTVPTYTGNSVPVSWIASAGTIAPTGYYVTRTIGGSTAAACGTSSTTWTTASTCMDTSVPTGTASYTVVAVYRSWTARSAPSANVLVSIANKLAFSTPPSTVTATTSITPSIAVTVQTSTGTAVPLAGISISLAFGANPGGGTLSGSLSAVTNTSGVATFSGVSIDKVGVGYTLVATGSGLISVTSAAFTVVVGAATSLVFITTPSDSFAGGTFFVQPATQYRDAGGNVATTNTSSVTLSLTSPAGAVLACAANPNAAVLGVSSFSGCSVSKVGTYTLSATGSSLTAVSASFTISAAPTNLAWGSHSSTTCDTPPTGSSFAFVYFNCAVLGSGTFTSLVSLTDASGTVLTNLGPTVTVTLTAAHGNVSAVTVTIAHGQTASSTSSTFSAAWPLLVVVDRVTASATGVTNATADLHALLV